jgi:hypothetical protein
LQAIREKAGTLRRADVPSEYKSDVVLPEIMSPDSSVKRVAESGMIGVRFQTWAVVFHYQLMIQPETFRCLLGLKRPNSESHPVLRVIRMQGPTLPLSSADI